MFVHIQDLNFVITTAADSPVLARPSVFAAFPFTDLCQSKVISKILSSILFSKWPRVPNIQMTISNVLSWWQCFACICHTAYFAKLNLSHGTDKLTDDTTNLSLTDMLWVNWPSYITDGTATKCFRNQHTQLPHRSIGCIPPSLFSYKPLGCQDCHPQDPITYQQT